MIRQLIHGLAVYEKEEDSVHITSDDYHVDSFTSYPPLFYCFLLECHHHEHRSDITNHVKSNHTDNKNKNKNVMTFGMAFCHIGYTYC
jgi:ABC-type nickel/cobalt efflux system permease component RcnA